MIKCALQYKIQKIKNTNALIFTSLKRIRRVLIKNSNAMIFEMSM